jgi:drug/metabolite transporter (DMT)-like permease
MRPHLVVAVGVAFTALSAIFVRLSDAPPLAIAAYRMIFTTVLVAPLFARERLRARRRSEGDQSGEARDPSLSARRAVLLSLASGAFLALHFALWITSLSYTSIASSTVLVTTHPIIVGLVAFALLGEQLSFRAVAYMLGGLAGSVVLVWAGFGAGESALLGNLLAFLGAVTVSAYMLIGRVVRRRLSVNVYTMIVYSTSAVLLTAAALVAGVSMGPYPAGELALFAALALFCTLLGHSLFNWALKFVRPMVVSTSILGEPVIASTLGVIVFGEVPAISTLIGGGVILASIYLFVREEARVPARERAS